MTRTIGWLQKYQNILSNQSCSGEPQSKQAAEIIYPLDRVGLKDPRTSSTLLLLVFISWEPNTPNYLKINFNDSIHEDSGNAGFVIHKLNARLIHTSESYLFKPAILIIELRVTWTKIAFAQQILWIDHLVIEDDFVKVVGWIHSCMREGITHLLLLDINRLLIRSITFDVSMFSNNWIWQLLSISFDVKHVFRKLNTVTIWIVSFYCWAL